jgi:hypothetical protein
MVMLLLSIMATASGHFERDSKGTVVVEATKFAVTGVTWDGPAICKLLEGTFCCGNSSWTGLNETGVNETKHKNPPQAAP